MKAKVLFEGILNMLKENGDCVEALAIMDYHLSSNDNHEFNNSEIDFSAVVNYGASEGIYIDCYIDDTVMNYKISIGVFKTLEDDLKAMKIMGELCGALTYYARKFINQNEDKFTSNQLEEDKEFEFTLNECNEDDEELNKVLDALDEDSETIEITEENVDQIIKDECIELTTEEDFANRYDEVFNHGRYKEIPDTAFLFKAMDTGKWIAIDNSDWNCWIEEFETKLEAVNWLVNGLFFEFEKTPKEKNHDN